jgi:AraC-like DNA-binding protein
MMMTCQDGRPMPGSGETWIRPEWLFLIVNRVQAMAASPEVGCVPPPPEKLSEVFRPESDLERKLAQSLFARLEDEQNRWAARLPDPADPTIDELPLDATPLSIAVGRAQSLLQADLARHWTLEALASRVGCNRTDLETGFRRNCYCTVHTYLVLQRVAAAKELLRTTAWRIQEVAKAVGFRSKVSLYENLRRTAGMTPDEYRRRWMPVPARHRVRAILPEHD